ncbi:FUSC family protein [Granulicella paludicola]|uniref:FUSC family protein n=1 Tax=Granulicella paludicola TaxID=474951 RepID=UPI0021E09127|nr:FUSC family protein [Granulicella paludicola]
MNKIHPAPNFAKSLHDSPSIYPARAVLNVLTISTDTTLFPWAKRTPLAGLRAVLAIVLALVLGQRTGHASAGAIAAGAAFTIGFAIFHEALASALLSMGLLTLGIASATLVGSLGAQYDWLVLLLVVIAAINYGVLSDLSPTAGWMGMQCATFLIIASYFPRGLHFAIGRTAMVVAGGILQMLIFTGFHFLRHARSESIAPPLTQRLRLRAGQLWTRLRDELHPTHETASYTLRLALTLLLCTAIYRHFHIRNGYWCPMTALLVMKPKWNATLSRSIARLLGTIGGAAIALLLARFVNFSLPVILICVVVFAWAAFALQAVNYAVFSLFVTLYVVFLFRSGGFSQTSAAHIRLFNTALGGGIALLIDAAGKLIALQRTPHPAGPAQNFVQ